jgi:hypothetical protein
MFYGLDKTEYPSYFMQIMNRTKNNYKQAVNSVSMYVSDVIADKLDSTWSVLVPTTNPINPDPEKRTQNIPLQNIFMHYYVDLDLLSQGFPYNVAIISFNFWITV